MKFIQSAYIIALSILLFSFSSTATEKNASSQDPSAKMKINVHLGKNTFLVTLNDSPAAAALYRQLPVTIKFGDLFSREKHGVLPDSLPEEGPRTFTYKVGDLAYWSPSGDIAFYYRDDGQKIPSPGVIMLGQANPKDMSLLDVTGPVDLTLEKAK